MLAYNGTEWEVHGLKTGKKERSLAFDKNTNRLYVGSQGAFGYFTDDWKYVSLIDKIPDTAKDFDEVWDVFLFNSKVYFCTFQGIYIYDGNNIEIIGQKDNLGKSFLVNGKLFTQNQQGKLLEIKDQPINMTHYYISITDMYLYHYQYNIN